MSLLKYESISHKIYENLQNASCTPIKFFNYNEETPLGKTHPRPWTSKKEVLDTIKRLYFMCDGKDNIEHLCV